MSGLRTPTCGRCRDGVYTLHTGTGKRAVACTCPRGIEREEEEKQTKLRDDLVAAFKETRKT